MSDTPTVFSMALRLHRDRLGISQTEAAALIGCSLPTLSNWERGVSEPKPYEQEGALARLKRARVQERRVKL